VHDRCFDKLEFVEKTWKESMLINLQGHLLLNYYSTCEDGEFTCDASKNTPYLQGVCECDRVAGKCFYENSDKYRPQLYSLEKERYCESMENRHELNMTQFENRKIKADLLRAQLWPDVFTPPPTISLPPTSTLSTTSSSNQPDEVTKEQSTVETDISSTSTPTNTFPSGQMQLLGLLILCCGSFIAIYFYVAKTGLQCVVQ